MNRILLTLVLSVFLMASCSKSDKTEKVQVDQKKEQAVLSSSSGVGEKIYKAECMSCHVPSGKPTIAPPIFAVKDHVIKSHPERDAFVAWTVEWVKTPNEKSALMPGAVGKFGLMPAMTHLSDADLIAVSEYLYDTDLSQPNWYKAHYEAEHGAQEVSKADKSLEAEAKGIVKAFGGTLKPKLQEAIQSGGLVHAIDVCAVEAPKIAKDLSVKTGWSVKRASLKPRNTDSVTPDAFEKKVLEEFNQRLAAGEQISEISHSEIVDNEFRFMKAQGTEAVCLNCHGQSIQSEVKEAILKQYPNDVATGYTMGQIRGAFSLSKSL